MGPGITDTPGGLPEPRGQCQPLCHPGFPMSPLCQGVPRTWDSPEVVTQPQKRRKGSCRLRQEAEPKGRESQRPLLGLQGRLEPGWISCWQDGTRRCAQQNPRDRSPSVLTLTCAVLLTSHFTPKRQRHHLLVLAFLSTAPLCSEKPPEFFLSSSVGNAQPGLRLWLGVSGWTAKRSGSGCSVTLLALFERLRDVTEPTPGGKTSAQLPPRQSPAPRSPRCHGGC